MIDSTASPRFRPEPGPGESLVIPGGAVYRADVVEVLSKACSSGAGFVRHGRTLLSISSTHIDRLLAALESPSGALVYGRSEEFHAVDMLLNLLDNLVLDYRLSQAGQMAGGSCITLRDAAAGRLARFPAHRDRIVLTADAAQDAGLRGAALAWSLWQPRPFRICDSRHAFLAARAEAAEMGRAPPGPVIDLS